MSETNSREGISRNPSVTGKSALQSATEFAETVFTPEKWEWLNKLKASEDRGENGGKSAEGGGESKSSPLTENHFRPEKWEWVVKLNQMTMSDRQTVKSEKWDWVLIGGSVSEKEKTDADKHNGRNV